MLKIYDLPQLIIQGMISEEQALIKVQIYHELIGSHSFQFSPKTHTSDLRLHIQQNSPLYIYDNFHLQIQGARLPDCNQIAEIFSLEARLQVVFDPYDHYSSHHHLQRVRKVLSNPGHWANLHARDQGKGWEEERQEFKPVKLEELFEQAFSSSYLVDTKRQEDLGSVIGCSGFNPPSQQRRLNGDLYYLQVRSPEDIDFHITANADGFFVNQSTQGNFNPHPHPKHEPFLSLLQLLFHLSSKLRNKFAQLQRTSRLSESERGEGQGWLGGTVRKNQWRNEGVGQSMKNDFTVIKDWMEIFQYQLGPVGESIIDKIGREKLRYRIYQEFVQNVKDCVLKIFSGTIEALNPTSPFEQQIFYYSSLLFYFAEEGAGPCSSSAAGKQAQFVSFAEHLDLDNVYLARSAVVSYRGFKVVAKTVPSSFLAQHDDPISAQALFAEARGRHNDQAIVSALLKIRRALGLEGEARSNAEVAAHVSPSCKRFLLELGTLGLRDPNFGGETDGCWLRPQLFRIYNSRSKPKQGNSLVNSRSVISPEKQSDRKTQSLAHFAKEEMVSSLIDSFDGDMRKHLADSQSIIAALHKFGLSSHYLGMICKKAEQRGARHVRIMLERAILVRSLKTLFRRALRQTPTFLTKTVVRQLLNCVFCDQVSGVVEQESEAGNARKNRKRKTKESESCFEIHLARGEDHYCHLSSSELWRQAGVISMDKYKHPLGSRSSFFQHQFSRTAILRDLCIDLGIVLDRRDYFTGEGLPFAEQHILAMVPRVKVALEQAKEVREWVEEGDRLSAKFQVEEAFQAYNKAFQYVFSSSGETHQQLGLMYKKFAQLHFRVGDLDSAVLFAHNSLELYHQLLGPDHVETIEALAMVGIYQFGRKRFDAAEHYLLKAIFMAKLAYSECYPEVMVMHLNLSTVYEAQRKFTDAIMSLFMALNISITVYGNNHLHTAILYSALASLHYDIPDIEQAIRFQAKAVNILEQLLGSDDERVAQAKSTCEGYRSIQNSKKIREVHEKEQRNPLGLPSFAKLSLKPPFYDMRQRPSDFLWKKPRKLKYFF